MKKLCVYTLGLLFVLFAFSQCNQESIVIDYQTDYASTYNSRHVELVLRSIEDQKVYKMKLDCDPRYWFPDELHTLKINSEWPEILPGGQYELFINLPDPEPSLYHRAEYAIRLASKYELTCI